MANTNVFKDAVETLRNNCKKYRAVGCTGCTFNNTFDECELYIFPPELWTDVQPQLSDIEIQLLKICKQLGFDHIEVREHLGSVFTVAYGNKEYHTWRLPEPWGGRDRLFSNININQNFSIDDLLAGCKS